MNITDVLINSKRTLTEKLLDRIGIYDIFCEFIGEDVGIGVDIISPIRVDTKPTFRLFIPRDKDEVFFKDFAWIGGNVFTFVKHFASYQENISLGSRYEIIRYIDLKLGLGMFGGTPTGKITRRAVDYSLRLSSSNILFKSRRFTARDMKYWNKYFITEEILKIFNVRSVAAVLNDKGKVMYTISVGTLVFVYVIFDKVKMYRPEDKSRFKWLNTCPSHYYQGLEQLISIKSSNNKLLWNKSLKDAMVFFRFLSSKYDVIAPHGESYIPEQEFLDFLFKKYVEIIIIYDFDRAGVAGANRLRKRDARFTVMFVSTFRISINGKRTIIDKDISDYAEWRTEDEVKAKLINMNLWTNNINLNSTLRIA